MAEKRDLGSREKLSQMKALLVELGALRFTPWYRWHPQLALRYLPVVEGLRKLNLNRQKLKILEIGSGGLGIVPYLRQPVTGVDLRFKPPIHPLLTPVRGDAVELKFGDGSFDVVLCLDMLEHVKKDKRQAVVGEMLRVATRAVVIGAPCGRLAGEQDRRIRGEYQRRRGSEFPLLKEQVVYGLPEKADILSDIKVMSKRLKKPVSIAVQGNLNLSLRWFLMRGWMSDGLVTNLVFRKAFLLLIPLFRWLDRPPYYRQLFMVEMKGSFNDF